MIAAMMSRYETEFAELARRAESGADWAEICRLEALVIAGPDLNTDDNLHADVVAERHESMLEDAFDAALERPKAGA